jgi:hypothetical protein
MAQAMKTSYDLLRGGLDLVTPAAAMPAGRAIAALNYEPEARGYRRIGGYERYNGMPSPSLGANPEIIAARRAAIDHIPGSGPVRGVYIYDGALFAFRDNTSGDGQMFKATDDGWVKQTFGTLITFNSGTSEYSEGEKLLGATSAAIGTIDRVVLQSGQWNGTAAGYLVVSTITGTFGIETAGDSLGGSATLNSSTPIRLTGGGHYDFAVHNFYGAARRDRLYGTNGVDPAFEFNGRALSPIKTGNEAGSIDTITRILTRAGATILTRAGARIIGRGVNDKPSHIGVYANHLFLSFDAGSLMHSGVGEPMDFRVAAGAGEISFGGAPTGILSSVTTSLVIFGQSRIEYMTGTSSDDFRMLPISDVAGSVRWSTQMAGASPIYLDEAGLRRLDTTAAFGDWKMGTLSEAVEPLFRAKREAGVKVSASVKVKSKDQYWLFFDDGTGIIMYLGREAPEIMPIRFPDTVFCACSGEMSEGAGERVFVGATDGNVYELDRGTSFDGAMVPAYVRLAWNSERAPTMEKRFHSARFETDNASDMAIGVTYSVDFNASTNLAGELRNYLVAAGSPDFLPVGSDYSDVDWTVATAGEIYADDLSGLGRNIALTLISNHTSEEPHTLATLALSYSARRQLR